VKAIVGDIPVVNALDLHGNITPRSIEISSAMVGYRTYPHVDLYETGQRCAYVLRHLLEGRPIFKAFRQIPYIPPIHTQSTNTEPARSLYAMLGDLESDPKMVSATVMMGFPPADMPDCGASVFTYATTQKTADQACEKIYDFFLAHEADFGSDLPNARDGVAQAIRVAKTADKPVIVSDVQDNSGGGATSDTVWILEELVRQNAPDSALGLLFDPAAAAAAHEAGIGRQVTLDLGGKLTPGQTPFHATFTVEGLAEGNFICTGPMYKGSPANLGKMAQLRIGNVRVAVSSVRVQMADQAYFRQVGIEPLKMKIIVVKSANHFRADFEPISSSIIPVAAPGAIVEDPSKAEYHHLRDGLRLKGLGPVYHAK
jgi:microcystin degradation protein MlrC